MSSHLPTDEALEKEDGIDKKQNIKKTANSSRTCCKHSRPLPYHMPKKLDAPVLEATQHHRPTQPPKNINGVTFTTTTLAGLHFR